MENFGGLSGYHFCPEEPLEYLCAPNGSGKTTFAAFVCAMFYGLGSARTRKNLEEVPRKKYKPWQQGTWGGWIRFAAGTKQYRIERTFSEKEREDTFALIDLDTGMVSQDYTENIGEELFGMTKATYQATAFMSWNHMRVEVNENMRIGFFDGTQDTGLLKSKQAAAAIEAEYREYKKTGNRGELAQVTEELNRLSMQEWELERQMKQLSEQKMPISLQTENTGEDIQEEKPGSSTTGLTAEEEERLFCSRFKPHRRMGRKSYKTPGTKKRVQIKNPAGKKTFRCGGFSGSGRGYTRYFINGSAAEAAGSSLWRAGRNCRCGSVFFAAKEHGTV